MSGASGALAPSPGLWLQEEQGDLGHLLIAMTFCWGWPHLPSILEGPAGHVKLTVGWPTGAGGHQAEVVDHGAC